jgi:transcriptional regulator with XRE-family HTH domain
MESFSKRRRKNAKLRYDEIVRLLRNARREDGWSQEVVAYAVGCRQSDLSRWENGKKRISVVDLENLAALYNLPLAHFATIGMKVQSNGARTGGEEFRRRAREQDSYLVRVRKRRREMKGKGMTAEEIAAQMEARRRSLEAKAAKETWEKP